MQGGLEIRERDYFKEPLIEAEIRELASLASAEDIFARRSPSLKNMGLDGQNLTGDEIVGLMLQEPRLIRRPIMRVGDRLFVGATASVLSDVQSASASEA